MTMTLEDQRMAAEQLCREVMGQDYISVQEMTDVFGWVYNGRQINTLERTIPTPETLQSLKLKKYVLLPTPSVYCDARMVQGFDRDGSFGEADPDYLTGEVVLAGHWLAFHKGSYPRSGNKSWAQQTALLSADEYVPNGPEAEYALLAWLYVRKRCLLKSGYTLRTSSSDDLSFHYPVGLNNDDMDVLYGLEDSDRYHELGLAAAYKLPVR